MENAREKNNPRNATKPMLVLTVVSLVSIILANLACENTATSTANPFAASTPAAPDFRVLNSEALQVLANALDDPNPMVRANAVEVVASTRRLRLIPKVRRLLGDEFVPVRFAAALAIGDLQYAFGKDALAKLLTDPDRNVMLAASYAMAKLGAPEYYEVLQKAIVTKNQTLRANAALLLGKYGDPAAIKQLYWALREPDSEDKVVFQAAESIAMLHDERIFPKLWTMLISAHWDLRIMGARAMGALATPEAKNALITLLKDDIPEVRLAAAEQLGALKDDVGQAQILEILRTQQIDRLPKKQARERANVLLAKAIARVPAPALVKYLPGLLRDESPFVRTAAAEAVFRCTLEK